jgi:hypothetical protein
VRQCPICDYLIELSDTECRFCGNDLAIAELEAGAEERVAAAQARALRASPSPLAVSIVAALILGLAFVVALV